jgi:ABC-2 type transport system permease protein
MDDLALEARAVWAVAVKELKQSTRYKIDLSAVLILPVFQFLVPTLLLSAAFLVGGRPVGFLHTTGTSDVAAYYVLGAVVSAMTFGAFWGAAFSFRREQMQGTLEPLWLVPTRPHALVAGYALANFATSIVGATILFALAVFAFGSAQAHLLSAVRALPVLLCAALALIGVAYLMSSAVLLLREPNVFVDVGSFAFQVLSGVQFPVAMLPAALGLVSYLLPTTYALDLLRIAGLGTRPLLPPAFELALLVAITAGLVPMGAWVFSRTERRIRRTGTLNQH